MQWLFGRLDFYRLAEDEIYALEYFRNVSSIGPIMRLENYFDRSLRQSRSAAR